MQVLAGFILVIRNDILNVFDMTGLRQKFGRQMWHIYRRGKTDTLLSSFRNSSVDIYLVLRKYYGLELAPYGK